MGQMRKEIADLLRANKQENARIRVESVIREINLLQVFQHKKGPIQMLQLPRWMSMYKHFRLACAAPLLWQFNNAWNLLTVYSVRGFFYFCFPVLALPSYTNGALDLKLGICHHGLILLRNCVTSVSTLPCVPQFDLKCLKIKFKMLLDSSWKFWADG